jgi:hypothetical protein
VTLEAGHFGAPSLKQNKEGIQQRP